MPYIPLLFALLFIIKTPRCQKTKYKIRTVAFYNVENLFDTVDDPDIFDEDYTPKGKNNYSPTDYKNKIENIGWVISQIGYNYSRKSPALIGLSEVENRKVLKDLVRSEVLIDHQYDIIHFDSPDLRGIDVAFLYKKHVFSPIDQENIEVRIWNEKGERMYTRDILWLSGIMDDELIHVIINHWPSRRGGRLKSEPKRMKAAHVLSQIIDRIHSEQPNAKVLIMGDFNDDPINNSVSKGILNDAENDSIDVKLFYNPMTQMYRDGLNSLAYRDGLHLFDQVIVSQNLLRSDTPNKGYTFYKAGIFNPSSITNQSGRYRGYPKRSFKNNKFAGGYSDHFPVYVYLIKKYTE